MSTGLSSTASNGTLVPFDSSHLSNVPLNNFSRFAKSFVQKWKTCCARGDQGRRRLPKKGMKPDSRPFFFSTINEPSASVWSKKVNLFGTFESPLQRSLPLWAEREARPASTKWTEKRANRFFLVFIQLRPPESPRPFLWQVPCNRTSSKASSESTSFGPPSPPRHKSLGAHQRHLR